MAVIGRMTIFASLCACNIVLYAVLVVESTAGLERVTRSVQNGCITLGTES